MHPTSRSCGELHLSSRSPSPRAQIMGLLDWISAIVARPGFGQRAAAAAVATEALEGGDGSQASQVGGGSAAGGANEVVHAGQGEQSCSSVRVLASCTERNMETPVGCFPNEAESFGSVRPVVFLRHLYSPCAASSCACHHVFTLCFAGTSSIKRKCPLCNRSEKNWVCPRCQSRAFLLGRCGRCESSASGWCLQLKSRLVPSRVAMLVWFCCRRWFRSFSRVLAVQIFVCPSHSRDLSALLPSNRTGVLGHVRDYRARRVPVTRLLRRSSRKVRLTRPTLRPPFTQPLQCSRLV